MSNAELIREKPKRSSLLVIGFRFWVKLETTLWLVIHVVVASPPSAGRGSGPFWNWSLSRRL